METNWEKLRKEKGIDYSEIHDKYYWYSEETIRRWFSGQQKPRYNNIIDSLCQMFGIPFSKGKQMFEDDHQTYLANKDSKQSQSTAKPITASNIEDFIRKDIQNDQKYETVFQRVINQFKLQVPNINVDKYVFNYDLENPGMDVYLKSGDVFTYMPRTKYNFEIGDEVVRYYNNKIYNTFVITYIMLDDQVPVDYPEDGILWLKGITANGDVVSFTADECFKTGNHYCEVSDLLNAMIKD